MLWCMRSAIGSALAAATSAAGAKPYAAILSSTTLRRSIASFGWFCGETRVGAFASPAISAASSSVS